MTTYLDGKKTAQELLQNLKIRVDALQNRGVQPKLVFFLIGNNPASRAYVNMKQKACQKIGITSTILEYPETVSPEEVHHKIQELNQDAFTHGILVQLPLPAQFSVRATTNAISPQKDVDGLHAYNAGNLIFSAETEQLPAATALGIIRLLEQYHINLEGLNVVILGRSILVGKPIAAMLTNRNATVTICHRKTKEIIEHSHRADLVIAAAGSPQLVHKEWIKEGAIVIDAGYGILNGKAVGDVDFEEVAPKCSLITPVPGGCGPMTIYSILENTVKAAEHQNSESKHL